jgi:hypothetical protein
MLHRAPPAPHAIRVRRGATPGLAERVIAVVPIPGPRPADGGLSATLDDSADVNAEILARRPSGTVPRRLLPASRG